MLLLDWMNVYTTFAFGYLNATFTRRVQGEIASSEETVNKGINFIDSTVIT
jgi:hypothetical protein